MRVLVDLLFVTGRRGGMESYVRELYSAMPDDDVEFVGLASRQLAASGADWFPGSVVDSRVDAASRARWAMGELVAVRAAARRLRADVIHAPANLGSRRPGVPQVTTVHDLLPFVRPEFVPGRYAPLLRWLIRGAVRASARVVTPSRASAEELVRVLGVPPDRIDIVPLGAPSQIDRAQSTREPNLLLAVGNAMPHKNLATLVHAVAMIPRSRRPRLVIAGGGTESLRDEIDRRGVGEHVDTRGWVSDHELDRLYRSATATVLPTLFEGFGLPLLEAMSRGCPVIASDLPVLREVGSDAAIWVDSGDPSRLARALEDALQDRHGLERLSIRGMERASRFSWAQSAQSTLDSLRRATR